MSVVSRDVPNCPICNSPAVLVDAPSDGGLIYTVICLNIERCGLGSGFFNSPDEALRAWDNQKSYAQKVLSERRDKA